MANGHGGSREGAGRKQQPHTRLGRQALEQARETGLLPHEILLDMARGNPQKVRRYEELADGSIVLREEWVALSVEEQRDAAKAAAPYYAPKLSTVETVQGISDDDIDELIASLAAQAGIASRAGGEGQEDEAAAGQPRRARRRVEL